MEKITVISNHSNPKAFEIREFLYRHVVPFDYYEPGIDKEADTFLKAHPDLNAFPAVLFPNGKSLQNPNMSEIACEIGLHKKPKLELYDLAIMGSGPAGLAAAIYAGSEGLMTIVVERHSPGGRAGSTSMIENLIAHPQGITGSEFTERSREQAEKFGVEFIVPVELNGIFPEAQILRLSLSNGETFFAKSLIVAVGVHYRLLKVPGIENFIGRGIYYGAAMTEGHSNLGKEVCVVGGANSAGQAAMYFSRFAKTVNLIVRGDSIAKRMSSYLIKEIHDTKNIRVHTQSEIRKINGSEELESLEIKNLKTGENSVMSVNSLFLLIGGEPHTECLVGKLVRDKSGFLLTGRELENHEEYDSRWKLNRKPFPLETNIPGVFVAGDVRSGTAKRIAAAIGDGANAITQISDYFNSLNKLPLSE